MLTEDEAKTKWCPAARVTQISGEAGNRYAFDHDGSQQAAFARCIASACMAWRWIGELKTFGPREAPEERRVYERGFCGLAGKP